VRFAAGDEESTLPVCVIQPALADEDAPSRMEALASLLKKLDGSALQDGAGAAAF
jgi:hypothetical protein